MQAIVRMSLFLLLAGGALSAGALDSLVAGRLPKPPAMDGKIGEDWKAAGVVPEFQGAKIQTRAYVGFDDDNLYFAFHCREPKMDGLVANCKQRDGAVWEDDCVDVFLDVNHDKRNYYHLQVNTLGTQFDQKGLEGGGRIGPAASDISWNPKWQVAVGKGGDYWEVEICIPLSELGVGLMTPFVWGINLARERPGRGGAGAQYSRMRDVAGQGFHSPQSFATLKLDYNWAKIAEADFQRCREAALGAFDDFEKDLPLFGADPRAAGLAVKVKEARAQLQALGAQIEAAIGKVKSVAGEEGLAIVRKAQQAYAAFSANADAIAREQQRLAYSYRMQKAFGIAQPAFALAVLDSATKAFQHLDYRGQITNSVRLALARNEYEACQAVLLPLWDELPAVTVAAGDLKSASGAVLAATNIDLLPVGYVRTKATPLKVKFVGWTPDMLLPNGQLALKGRPWPVWIRVRAPAGTPAGIYSGPVTFSAGEKSCQLNLTVEVYNFELPVTSTLRTAFYFEMAGNMKVLRPFYDMLLSHRISGVGLYTQGTWPPQHHLEYCMARGQNVVTLGGLDAAVDDPGRRAYYEFLKSKGWDKYAVFYITDEPGAGKHPNIIRTAKAVHEIFPGVPTLGALEPNPALFGAMDIWCPVMGDFGHFYKKDACDARKKAGEQVWMYVCADPWPPYPNLMMDNDGLDPRIIPWMLWREQLGGLLYYYVIHWWPNNSGEEKFALANGPLYANWDTYSHKDHNGDGMLIYPGPVCSTRLENLRDGIEDYEYFASLRRLLAEKGGKLSAAERKQVEECLGVDPAVVRDFTQFTKQLGPLYGQREKLARLIEKMQ